jgi:DNA-binding NarL/FixJ family response regulator
MESTMKTKTNPMQSRGARDVRSGVIVADASPIDRAGLSAILSRESDLEVLAEAGSVADALEACRVHRPDALLVTLSLPGGNGGGPIPALLASAPDLRIVALSQHSRDRCVVLSPPHVTYLDAAHANGNGHATTNGLANGNGHAETNGVENGNGHAPASWNCGVTCLQLAAQQGAQGTVRRDSDSARLVETVRKVVAGGTSYDANDDDCGAALLPATSSTRALSDRERTVAALIARGLSNKEIGTALDISEATVKKHVGRVLSKLGFQDRLQVGLFLARNPLVLEQPQAM